MNNKNKDIREILNPLGFAFLCLMVFSVFAGFAAPYVAPHSFLGIRMTSISAKIIYAGIVIACSYIIEILLKYFGIHLGKK